MSTLSREPKAPANVAEETRLGVRASRGPCHGKAHLTRDPKAFQVLSSPRRGKEEKRKGMDNVGCIELLVVSIGNNFNRILLIDINLDAKVRYFTTILLNETQ